MEGVEEETPIPVEDEVEEFLAGNWDWGDNEPEGINEELFRQQYPELFAQTTQEPSTESVGPAVDVSHAEAFSHSEQPSETGAGSADSEFQASYEDFEMETARWG